MRSPHRGNSGLLAAQSPTLRLTMGSVYPQMGTDVGGKWEESVTHWSTQPSSDGQTGPPRPGLQVQAGLGGLQTGSVQQSCPDLAARAPPSILGLPPDSLPLGRLPLLGNSPCVMESLMTPYLHVSRAWQRAGCRGKKYCTWKTIFADLGVRQGREQIPAEGGVCGGLTWENGGSSRRG